jgi:hypothetical protein
MHTNHAHTQRLAWCLGGLGALLVVRKAARQLLLRWREHQARERVRKALLGQQQQQQQQDGAGADAGASSSGGGGGGVQHHCITVAAAGGARGSSGASAAAGRAGGGAAPHSSHEPAGVCVVCLSAPSEMVFVRCGHMCCCSKCCSSLPSRRCPVCRSEGAVIKVFRT